MGKSKTQKINEEIRSETFEFASEEKKKKFIDWAKGNGAPLDEIEKLPSSYDPVGYGVDPIRAAITVGKLIQARMKKTGMPLKDLYIEAGQDMNKLMPQLTAFQGGYVDRILRNDWKYGKTFAAARKKDTAGEIERG